MNNSEGNFIETRVYYTWMGADGIARTRVKPGSEIVLEDAKENSRIVNGLSGAPLFPLIIDTREIKSITKEARDFFSIRGRDSRVNRFAIIVDSPLSRIIGNFFMGLNKPRVPTKLFSDERLAVEWCLECLISENA